MHGLTAVIPIFIPVATISSFHVPIAQGYLPRVVETARPHYAFMDPIEYSPRPGEGVIYCD